MRKWPHDRVKLANEQVETMHARLSGAQYRHANPGRPGYRDASEAEIEHWRDELRKANDVYRVLDLEAQPPPPLHTCARPIIVDNTAEHARLERERSQAHAAQILTRGLTDAGLAALHAQETAAIVALRELRLVRQVRLFNVWTVTIWIVDPGSPKGYDTTAVHDSGTVDPLEPSSRFDLPGATRYAGELCGYILT